MTIPHIFAQRAGLVQAFELDDNFTALDTSASGEVARAQAAESSLSESISAETTRAERVESGLFQGILAEQQRAETAEGGKVDRSQSLQAAGLAQVSGDLAQGDHQTVTVPPASRQDATAGVSQTEALTPSAAAAITRQAVELKHYAGSEDLQPVLADLLGRSLISVRRTTGRVEAALELGRQTIAQPAGGALYSGPEDLQPVAADAAGQHLISYRRTTGRLQSALELTPASAALAPSLCLYSGPEDYQPLVVDANGQIVQGFSLSGQAATGVAPMPLTTSYLPLAAADQPVASDWNGFISQGESLSVGLQTANPAAISTTQPYGNLTFGGGPKSAPAGNAYGAANTSPGTSTVVPLVESLSATDGYPNQEGETPCAGAANWASQLAALRGVAPASRAYFASAAGHGGYQLSGLEKGQPSGWYQLMVDQVAAAAGLAKAAGKGYVPQVVSLMIGHNDGLVFSNPGPYGAPQRTPAQQQAFFFGELQALWASTLADLPATSAAAQGSGAPAGPLHCLIYQTASMQGHAAVQGSVALAQFQFISANLARVHLSTPIYHLPYGPDGVHLSAVGYLLKGRYDGRALDQLMPWTDPTTGLVTPGRKPDCIWPIAATAKGLQLQVRFRVPRLPLVLDTSTLAATLQDGFNVQDATGAVALSGLQVVNGDTVQMTLARPLGASPVVRYALDSLAPGLNVAFGASGNLRDSTPDTCVIQGVSYPMWHVAPAFQLPITALDASS